MNHKSNSAEPSRFESLYPPDARFEEISKIISYIKSGNSCQVISLPGVGRSNVLRILAYNQKTRTLHLGEKQKLFHFVLMNFFEVKKRPLEDSFKYMFLELVESLEARKMKEEHEAIKKIFDESLKSNDEMVIFNGLKRSIDYLCLEKKLTIVFLFDRFEEYINVVSPLLFDSLRILRDRAKYHFSCVFPLNRPLEDTIGQENISSFYEFIVGNCVYLSLGDKQIADFRLKHLSEATGDKVDQKILSEIGTLTGGLGKLWLVSVETALRKSPNTKTADFLFSDSKIKAVLSEIWNSLTPFEQELIRKKRSYESSHLIAVGLVKNNSISVPLLERFALEIREENKNTGIVFNEETNEIIKDQTSLSERLTSSEFKALKYFVQNGEKVIERDEIIKAVWGELESTAGVTEQALDQLIFRIRKKIEENPNSPKHLQTIKGRGFKFTA